MTNERLHTLNQEILRAAIRVHEKLGPRRLAPEYEACLMFELIEEGLCLHRKERFTDEENNASTRSADLIVEDEILVRIETVTCVRRNHHAEMRSALIREKRPLGVLLNFHAQWIRNGAKNIRPLEGARA